MKRNALKYCLLGIITIASVNTFATTIDSKMEVIVCEKMKTETFKVYGNCGMCEKTIEGSLKGVDGISKADWNRETKMMEVVFDKSKISIKEIKKKIAGVGYDTDTYKATDDSYNALPGCCQYERSSGEKNHNNHSKSCH